jgi:hypothetical protein
MLCQRFLELATSLQTRGFSRIRFFRAFRSFAQVAARLLHGKAEITCQERSRLLYASFGAEACHLLEAPGNRRGTDLGDDDPADTQKAS